MIEIVIADDHVLFRDALKHLLTLQGDMMIVGEASSGGEVLECLRKQACNLLLLDISMPGISGAELIRRVRTRYPDTQVLVLSMYNEPQLARRKLKAGATGYVTKDAAASVLIDAIRKVAAGGRFIVPSLAEQIAFDDATTAETSSHHQLTERELQILRMLAQGKGLNEIARELSISNKTVSTHKVRMMRKMKITSNAELIRYCVTHRVVP